MTPVQEDELGDLIRTFYQAYMRRFEELADESMGTQPAPEPPVASPVPGRPPVPLLAASALDLVRVNGDRALHFFFTEPQLARAAEQRRVTKVHDIEVHPASVNELKAMADDAPDVVREQVRKTAAIEGELYVHFVVYPQDGSLPKILAHVASRVAEREVRGTRAGGMDRGTGADNEVTTEGPVKRFQPGPRDAHDAVDEWFHLDK